MKKHQHIKSMLMLHISCIFRFWTVSNDVL